MTIKSFPDAIADVFPISLFFFNNSLSFIKKDIYLVSSKSFLQALVFVTNIHKGQSNTAN